MGSRPSVAPTPAAVWRTFSRRIHLVRLLKSAKINRAFETGDLPVSEADRSGFDPM